MYERQIFAVWEKTGIFTGHMKLYYFTLEPFRESCSEITDILSREMTHYRDLLFPQKKTKSLLESIDSYIRNNQKTGIAFIKYNFPFENDMKLDLFGKKIFVNKAIGKLRSVVQQHTIKNYQFKLHDSQVNIFNHSCMLVLLSDFRSNICCSIVWMTFVV